MSRERVTIPVQVQGMVAWDGSCAAAAGHGFLFVMVGAWVSCFFINEGMGCVSSASGRVIN
jgi:hypothetical protein